MIGVDYVFVVEGQDVFWFQVQLDQYVYVGNVGCVYVCGCQFYFFDFFVGDCYCVEYGCVDDDCCVVLVVMEYWDFYVFVQFVFDYEVFWCFDVFQVDVVEGWFQ